jgi:hypothetical protein
MLIRKTSLLASLTVAIALPAMATSGVTVVNSDAGFKTHPMPSTVTRAQVQIELTEWRKNPVAGDGYREVGGERGWEAPQHAYIFRNGSLVHADAIDHNAPKASIAMTRAERDRFDAANRGSSQ